MTRKRFDAAYYRRFYRRSPVHTSRGVARLAEGVDALCSWWGLPIRSVLETGAGLGLWRNWYRVNRPRVRTLSTDASPYACQRYGHELRDLAAWAPARPFDLVICQSVLQYLGPAEAQAAIQNLAKATRHFLYFEVPTLDDLKNTVDRKATDLRLHQRTGRWYRQQLRTEFTEIGIGLWIKTGAPASFYELERPE